MFTKPLVQICCVEAYTIFSNLAISLADLNLSNSLSFSPHRIPLVCLNFQFPARSQGSNHIECSDPSAKFDGMYMFS